MNLKEELIFVKCINTLAMAFVSHSLSETCNNQLRCFKPAMLLRLCSIINKLDLVHMDVCGPLPESSLGGIRYVATFLDEYSQLSVVC